MAYILNLIGDISINCAYYDSFMGLPDDDSLKRIREGGLENLLPPWYDFERNEVKDRDKQIKWVQGCFDRSYLDPIDFLLFLPPGHKVEEILIEEFVDLNYLLVKNLLTIPHPERLSFDAYLFATGKSVAMVGMDNMSKLYDSSIIKISDSQCVAYERIILDQFRPIWNRLADEVTAVGGIYNSEKPILALSQYPRLRSIKPSGLGHL